MIAPAVHCGICTACQAAGLERKRLNAAAPALLAALKEAMPLLRFMARHQNQIAMDALPLAQAAINKAEGR